MSDFSPERFWSIFFNFFFTFMSDGHVGVVQFYTFRHQLTASPRHEIGSFGAKFIASGTQFRYSRNEIALSVINLALKWHFQVPFCNLGHELEHFMNLITEVCHQMYLCFYSKINLKNALRWLHESWGATPMCTVVNGCACMFALALQYVLWQHSHALSGVFSWAQTTAKAQA